MTSSAQLLPTSLNPAQLELLQLFASGLTDEQLSELRRILLDFKFRREKTLSDKFVDGNVPAEPTPTVPKSQPTIRIFKKGQEPDDIFYWLSRPPIERIRALEEIRQQYNNWKYGSGLEFQRVYTIVKRS